MAREALGYPLGFIVTGANVNRIDSVQSSLRKGSLALMDKGYDSDTVRDRAKEKGGAAIIIINTSRSLTSTSMVTKKGTRSRTSLDVSSVIAESQHAMMSSTKPSPP